MSMNGEDLRPLVRQQEMVISMMKERIPELEMELINTRCMAMFNQIHVHEDDVKEEVTSA